MIIALSGYGYTDCGDCATSMGTGKDTVADFLKSDFNFVRVGFADPIKRFVKDLFDFSDEQIWGPSEHRNKPDTRYIRRQAGAFGTLDGRPSPREHLYLTPRYALQTLGNEWGRDTVGPNVWINYALKVAKKIESGFDYDQNKGVYLDQTLETHRQDVVFSDLRYRNELECIKKEKGYVVRIKRCVQFVESMNHASEIGLLDVDDSEFDYIINNNGTIDSLRAQVAKMVEHLSRR